MKEPLKSVRTGQWIMQQPWGQNKAKNNPAIGRGQVDRFLGNTPVGRGSPNEVVLRERGVWKPLDLSEDNHFQQGVQGKRKKDHISVCDLPSHKERGKNRKIREAESSAD